MKIFNQLGIVLIIGLVGELISSLISSVILIPSSVVGMILLFTLLQFKVLKLERIETISDFLLSNMAIFFVPAGVSLITSVDIIKENILSLIVIISISTILVMYFTAKIVDIMISKKTKE